MIKVKNVRPGIVIIADARLKLTPGETADIEKATPQVEKALENGLLAKVEAEPVSHPKPKNSPKPNAAKEEVKTESKAESNAGEKTLDLSKLPAENPNGAG